jgi:uncharacterized protein (DUF427 family)
MGLSWQQGPLGRNPNGTFLTPTPMPERVLYVEPLRRGMSAEFGGGIVARSDGAVLLFEPARYPVAYFPVSDVAEGVLEPTDRETSYYDIGDAQHAAWSYRAPFDEMARIGDLVSFEPDKVTITLDGEKLEPVPGQTVVPHGADRNLSVDEVGGIQLVEV